MHLCLRKMYPNIRHNPSWQHGYCKQYPPNARLLTNLQRLSFATPLCNHPFYKPLHPPGLRPSPFLSILWKRKGAFIPTYTLVWLVGNTGLKPGAIERVRSPQGEHCLGMRWDSKSHLSAIFSALPDLQLFPFSVSVKRTLSDGLRPANSPCMTYALLQSTRGAIHIKPYITRQTKFSCISGKWSLLSKGLRGGKSRRLRVESLLRWMIASEDAKNPLKARKQKRIQGYGLLYPPERKG